MTYLSASERIEAWLLHSNVYLTSGPEAGAVAGWLADGGAPSFAYPEITGYYLTWLAFAARVAPRSRAVARERAGRSAEWLARWGAQANLPPTRCYLAPQSEEDWRNAAVFSYDSAMILRGVTHARWLCPTLPWQTLVKQPLALLLDLCTPDDALCPVKLREGHRAEELPETWSTTEGAHHVKTAAAILAVPERLLPGRLFAAAQKLLGRWAGQPWQRLQALPHHQLFYYLEGLVLLAAGGAEPRGWDEVAAAYAEVMQRQDAGGCLPSAPHTPTAPPTQPALLRSDVMAQALRIGSLLKAGGCLEGAAWDARLAGLAKALLSFVGADGGVSQYPLASGWPPQWNAWCGMFAHQAFVFYGSLVDRGASTLPPYCVELLI